MMLCDAAQSVAGKLYIIGGGWSQILVAGVPTNMALAVKLGIPWHETNRPIAVRAQLINDDGQPVLDAGGKAISADGRLEVGRPPGTRPGTTLDAPIALNFTGIVLQPGGYVWELTIDDHPRARTPFRVLGTVAPGSGREGGSPA